MSVSPLIRVLLMIGCGLAAVANAGCAPSTQLLGDAVTAPRIADKAIKAGDGARLPYREWRAARTRAVIVAAHGFNDYSNAFDMPGKWFARRGITTYAFDQRGFGETDQRGIWAGSEVMADDLATAVKLFADRHPGVPVYVMGVSMGAAVVMKAAAKGLPARVRGAILVAPAVWGWRAMNPLYKSALWLTAHTVPFMSATGRNTGIQASDNIPMLIGLGRDPLVIKETRFDAAYGLVTLMDEAHDAAAGIDIPVLYLYGAKDELVPFEPTLDVARKIRKKRFVYYDEGWHMLLRDKQRRKVWRDIAAWVSNRDGRLPSGEAVQDIASLVRHNN